MNWGTIKLIISGVAIRNNDCLTCLVAKEDQFLPQTFFSVFHSFFWKWEQKTKVATAAYYNGEKKLNMKRSKCGFCLLLNYKCLFCCWKRDSGQNFLSFFELCQTTTNNGEFFEGCNFFLAQKSLKIAATKKKFFLLLHSKIFSTQEGFAKQQIWKNFRKLKS